MYRVRQQDLPFQGSSHQFVGADNGSITHLVVSADRWVVRRFNDTAHQADGFDLDPQPTHPEGDQGISA